MTMSKSLALTAIAFVLAASAAAQPSDADVKKQLSGSGVLEVRLSKSPGVREWNTDRKNWEYRKFAEVLRSTEYPGVKLLVGGYAVYQALGPNTYGYLRFVVASNRYDGIPDPGEQEVQTLLSSDWKKFYGYSYNKITRLVSPPKLATDPGFDWDKPTSVSFTMTATFDVITSNTTIETVEQLFNVKFFRDDMKQPWKSFHSTAKQGKDGRTLLGTNTFTAEEIKQFEKRTLAFTSEEQRSKETAAALPAVEVPEFASMQDLVRFLHGILLDGSPEQLEAALLKVLSPRFFVAGSTTQLNQSGADLINKAANAAYKGAATYKLEYCRSLMFNTSLTTPKHAVLLACIDKVASSFDGEQINAGYVEGKPVLKWKLTNLSLGVRKDQDALNFLNSFSDRKKLCPND
ncbi:MAG: hypothetical protein IPP94_17715 [Ignavibacteria bacterium]|nr:hypothetical protein [Ignavibacteria bacterium]